MTKQKLLIFHPFIASYRVDLYNNLSKIFELKVFCWYEKIDDSLLGFDIKSVNQLAKFNYEYLKGSYFIKNSVINFSFGKVLRHNKPDIVLPHEFGLNTIITVLLRKHLKYKIFVTSDDSPIMAETAKGLRSWLRSFIINRIDGLIVVHPEVAEILEKKHKGSQCRYLFFPILQDDAVLKNKFSVARTISKRKIKEDALEDKKIILFVGRLVKEKGVDVLIRSFKTVLKREPNAILVIVGGGNQETELVNLIEELQLSKSVFLKGKLNNSELYAWYNLAPIFVLPSRFEPFGAVVNEALVAGCFTIVSDLVGAKCLINSVNGSVFESENIEELSQLIVNRLNISPIISTDAIKPNLMSKGLVAFTDDLLTFLAH
jgi:glycosyltransferase involved in cell wall biosynthesis